MNSGRKDKLERLEGLVGTTKDARERRERRKQAREYLDELRARRQERIRLGRPEPTAEEKIRAMADTIAGLKERARGMVGEEADRAWRAIEHLEDIEQRRIARLNT
jgi:hypothetical protein